MDVEISADDLKRAAAAATNATKQCSWLWVEAYSDACLALFKASQHFDGRGTWEGYSAQRMRWAAIDAVRRGLGTEGSVSAAIKTATPLSAVSESETDQSDWTLIA